MAEKSRLDEVTSLLLYKSFQLGFTRSAYFYVDKVYTLGPETLSSVCKIEGHLTIEKHAQFQAGTIVLMSDACVVINWEKKDGSSRTESFDLNLDTIKFPDLPTANYAIFLTQVVIEA